MKKTILSGLLLISTITSLHAQLYTPNNTIQGASGNNNVGIGNPNPVAKLTLQSSSENSNGGIKLLGFTYPNDQNYWSDSQFAMMYNGIYKNLIASNGISYFNGGNVGIGNNNPLYKLDIDNAGYGAKQIRWRAPNGQYGYTYSDGGGIGISNGDPYSELIYLHTGNKSLNFYTNGTHRAVIDASGNLGIGVAVPSYKLDIDNAGYGAKQIRWHAPSGQYGYTYSDGGGIGISNGDPYSELIYLRTTDKSLNFYTNGTQRAVIDASGNIGIGTPAPDAKLTVNGNIHAKEVKIDLLSPMTVPDYVFANDYKLKSLKEVEDYINKNSHLPEIPSAKELEKNGLMVAEMNMSLLKKVEELTLYAIEQNKRIEVQEDKNNILSKENRMLSERLSRIESQLPLKKNK